MKQMPMFDNTPQEVLQRRIGEDVPLFCSCGLGVNSTAGLILMERFGDRPDVILFADTGGEKPETYAFKEKLNCWLRSVGFPEVISVTKTLDHARQKRNEKYSTLEEECMVKKCLPSIAYYHRSCSNKWKQHPQDKFTNAWEPAQSRWKKGKKCVKAIFYDAAEAYRAKIFENSKWVYWHPLLDHNWSRDECVEAILSVGLPVPPKSSCFFCPEMTPEEIMNLEPSLLKRALAIEANAELTDIKGLGKHEFSWRDLVDGKVELKMSLPARVPCICYDGE